MEAMISLVWSERYRTSSSRSLYPGRITLERLMTKIVYGSANPRDLTSLGAAMKRLPGLKELLQESTCADLQEIFAGIDTLEDMARSNTHKRVPRRSRPRMVSVSSKFRRAVTSSFINCLSEYRRMVSIRSSPTRWVSWR